MAINLFVGTEETTTAEDLEQILQLAGGVEDTTPTAEDPEESSLLTRNVLQMLGCPVCYESMTAPILLCGNGHNVCHHCKPRLSRCPTCREAFLNTRNLALESLASKLGLDCKDCPSRGPSWNATNVPQFPCPLFPCSWTGERGSPLERHAVASHPEKVLHYWHRCTWKLQLPVRDERIVLCHGEAFVYRERLDTLRRKFHVAVQYVGAGVGHASRFKYEVELNAANGDKRLVVSDVVKGPEEDWVAMRQQDGCITIDYMCVSSFSCNNDLSYALRVIKKGT